MKKMNLFCLPFAGGNKYSYRLFSDQAPSYLNLITLEYPGRGSRMLEPLVSDVHVLVDDLYQQIKKRINEQPYAIYGHSMGGLVAYLLTHKILAVSNNLPEHIIITGTPGPSALSRSQKKRHLLEDEAFIQEIRNLGGMPEAILNNNDLLRYLEPILRNDFKTSETYTYSTDKPSLNIPFTIITGADEDIDKDEILSWQNETSLKADFKTMPGNHFFIIDHADSILEIISKKLVSQLTSLNYG